MATGVKRRISLVLQVTSSDTQCTATLLPGQWLEGNGTDMISEVDFIWCTDLLSAKIATKEVEAMRKALPERADVRYYHPEHMVNPMAVIRVNDETGEEELVGGTGCVVMRAQNIDALFHTIAVFFTQFMDLYAPVRDNGFVHEKAAPGAPLKNTLLAKTKIRSH